MRKTEHLAAIKQGYCLNSQANDVKQYGIESQTAGTTMVGFIDTKLADTMKLQNTITLSDYSFNAVINDGSFCLSVRRPSLSRSCDD